LATARPVGRTSGIAWLLVAMLLWGSAFVVSKAALAELPPFLFAFLRFCVASLCLWLPVRARGGRAHLPQPAPWGLLGLMGLTGVAVYLACFNLSLSYTTASDGALIQGSIPVVTALLAVAWLRERLGRARALGIGVSLLGVALVILAGRTGGDASDRVLGGLLMVGAVLAWAIYTIISKRLQGASYLAVSAYSTLIGTLLLLPGAVYDLATRPPHAVSLGAWLAVAYLAVCTSALAIVFWNRALQVLDASQVANFVNLVPLVGVATAALFLGERVTVAQLGGGLLVLAGVGLSSRAARFAAVAEGGKIAA